MISPGISGVRSFFKIFQVEWKSFPRFQIIFPGFLLKITKFQDFSGGVGTVD